VSLYEPRGSYQLIAQVALPLGVGELHAEFERVRAKLEAEGLLAPERKRALPKLPRVLGVVTSEHGAALHDVIRVASQRCPTRIVLSPCLVQGRDAPASIVAALRRIQRLPDLDVVIVGRGGGATEDLVAFNDEGVARALADCRVPVVSAVGHEVDVSIADLVADVRAATPSNAAELCVPDRAALERTLASAERALSRALEVRIGRMRLRLDRLQRGLQTPQLRVQRARARLKRAETTLVADARQRVNDRRRVLAELTERLSRCDPRLAYARDRARLHELRGRLRALAARIPERARAALAARSVRLHALSPLAVLGRGYAIALHVGSGKALLRATDAKAGDALELRLHDGSLRARVERDA
jgi:exodeoxyribonuclease VII large subunit